MKRILVVSLTLLLATGCASIVRGTTEVFTIESTPPGATATLSTGQSCETPCRLKIKRRGDFDVTIEKDGFETIRTSVTSGVDGSGAAGLAGNVLLGGIIGAGIDAGSGAMESHQPNPLRVTLTPLGSAQPASMDAAEIPDADADGIADEATEGTD